MFRLLVLSLLLVACAGSPAATPSAAPTLAPTAAPTAELTPNGTGAPTVQPPGTEGPDSTSVPSDGVGIPIGTDATGAFLVTPDGFSLYTFDNDSPGQSTCTDECADSWPPLVLAAGMRPTPGQGVTDTFGETSRVDGTTQVTYNDAPLYLYAGDNAPGDTNGDGANEVWHLARP